VATLVTCTCGQQFQTGEENAGRRAKCPECGRSLIIPRAISTAVGGETRVAVDAIEYPVSGKAIASLVLAAFSLVLAVVTGLPAVVLGCLGLWEIKKSRGRIRGRGMAASGVALGAFGCTFISALWVAPVVRSAYELSSQRQCTDNLKQIALAMHNFHDVYGMFPPAAITDKQGRPLLSWRVAILPQLGAEGEALFREFHLDEPWDSPHNQALLAQMPAVFACPDEPQTRRGKTVYQVIVGPATMFTGKRKGVRLQDITAGTSNTVMVAESARSVPWTAPLDIPADPDATHPGMGSRHPGGFNQAMADGRVRFVH
jgi:prepilin-type processing-associated H-X9-DG protein